jgi:hypothetical protein
MLETVRAFAGERLAQSAEGDEARRRHAEHMLAIARSANLTEEDDVPFQLEIVLAERDDVRAALDWSTEADRELALELAIVLENFWVAHAPHEGQRRLQRLLDETPRVPERLRARATRVYGSASDMSGDRELSERCYEESLRIFRALRDERNVASLLHRLAMCALWRGDPERARELAEESRDVSDGRFPLVDLPNDSILGQVLVQSGDVAGGTALVRQSADGAGHLGWDWWRAGQLSNLAFLALDRNDLEEAERDGRDGLRIVREQENRQWALWLMGALARAALARGETERAGLVWGAVQAEIERVPYGSWQARQGEQAPDLLAESGPGFLESVERGRELDLWHAAAIALGEEDGGGQTVP